jgi:hypothetical protein
MHLVLVGEMASSVVPVNMSSWISLLRLTVFIGPHSMHAEQL